MLSPELCQLLAYWHDLGGADALPERSQLDLRRLTTILPWMFILEMGADGSLRYRLAGSSLEEGVGCGMAGKTYADIFSDHEQASVMEELYATSLVQGSGLVRTGSFSLEQDETFDLEVLALPFSDTRAMAGTVLVGVVRPFDMLNQEFSDHWGRFQHDLTTLMVVPSPRVLSREQLSDRVNAMLELIGVELRALDVPKVLALYRSGANKLPGQEIPSFDLDRLSGQQGHTLN